MTQLFPWQLEHSTQAVESIQKHRIFCDTSGTGTGKTYMALATAKALGRPFLVITPKAAITQWTRVTEAFGLEPLDIINPERLIRSKKQPWYRDRKWHLPKDTLVIFDEIHRGASGKDSQTTWAMAMLRAYPSISLLALTATLAESPLKMRALGFWYKLHDFNEQSFTKFCLDYGCTYEDNPPEYRLNPATGQQIRIDKGQRLDFVVNVKHHMARLRETIGPRIGGIYADEIPGFPDEMIETILVDLTANERKEINQALKEMEERMLEKPGSFLASIVREREQVEFTKANIIAQHTLELVEDGYSVPVFLNFTSARQRVAAYLDKHNQPYVQIYGGQKDSERQSAIDSFQANEAPIILVMAQAGGVALSLHDDKQERPRTSVISPSYSASEFLQCTGRIRRTGGTKAVHHVLLAAGTREEKIATKLRRKLNALSALNDNDLSPF